MKAALRDASWFRNPDTGGAKKYHIINATEGHPNCGLPTLLAEESVRELKDVPADLRCTRNGCRQYWPEEEKNGC